MNPRRWGHVCAVGTKAEWLAHVLPDPADRRDLVAAAWLHDIGYAPDLVDTGLHALDGGRWLRDNGFSERIAGLVAHHSCAMFEAKERGLADVLAAEFPQEQSPTADALWYVDMTTGPDGQDLSVRARLAEVRARYGPNHLVTRFWAKAEPVLVDAVTRTEDRLAHQPM
ncbi:HDIG domain-containing protein [Virgisporangium ochraceum]|uniref:Metal-dependent phosphohydrolase, HD subdomain protein n=1 Tax=Virgisporangium ochraceum TaxID=65505 RepID=A0A8J3ZW76_9ACTN|nr:metal-dependent phosphohydrolase, HD subdomain protein [Virgisporangium ochraceum]